MITQFQYLEIHSYCSFFISYISFSSSVTVESSWSLFYHPVMKYYQIFLCSICMCISVCVCVRVTCVCVYRCTYPCACAEARGRCWVSCFSVVFLISLKLCLSVNLELAWKPSSPAILMSPPPYTAEVTGTCEEPHLSFYECRR